MDININIQNLNLFVGGGDDLFSKLEQIMEKGASVELTTPLENKPVKGHGPKEVLEEKTLGGRETAPTETINLDAVKEKIERGTFYSYPYCEHLAIYSFINSHITKEEFLAVTKELFDDSVDSEEKLTKEYYAEYDTGTDLPELTFKVDVDKDMRAVLEDREGHSYYITKQRGCMVKELESGKLIHFRLNKMGNGIMNDHMIREKFPSIGVIAAEATLAKYKEFYTETPVYQS